MSTTTHGLTSYDIQPAPFSEDELRQQWNAQADVDEGNHWDNLGLDEQLAWAQTRVIAADRAQGAPRDMPPPPAIGAIQTPAAAEPLWRVMQREYRWGPTIGAAYAAEIVAVRDRMFPGGRPDSVGVSDDCLSIWDELTTESDRAERGE